MQRLPRRRSRRPGPRELYLEELEDRRLLNAASPFPGPPDGQGGPLIVRVVERTAVTTGVESQPAGSALSQSCILFVSVTSVSPDLVVWSQEFDDGPAHEGLGAQVSAWVHEGILGTRLASYIQYFQDTTVFFGDGGTGNLGSIGDGGAAQAAPGSSDTSTLAQAPQPAAQPPGDTAVPLQNEPAPTASAPAATTSEPPAAASSPAASLAPRPAQVLVVPAAISDTTPTAVPAAAPAVHESRPALENAAAAEANGRPLAIPAYRVTNPAGDNLTAGTAGVSLVPAAAAATPRPDAGAREPIPAPTREVPPPTPPAALPQSGSPARTAPTEPAATEPAAPAEPPTQEAGLLTELAAAPLHTISTGVRQACGRLRNLLGDLAASTAVRVSVPLLSAALLGGTAFGLLRRRRRRAAARTPAGPDSDTDTWVPAPPDPPAADQP
jgi:hypothetical protein